MTANEIKVALLNEMVENGYCLCNRTIADYCRDFSVEDIRNFYQCFMGRTYPI